VDDELANQLVATMLYLDSEDKKDIRLYINATGGDVVPCLALHDTMRYLKSDVGTVGFGACMGMAGFLLAAGHKGKRCVLPNTRIMLHHPSGATRGQAADIDNEARELMRTRNYVNRVLARATDKDVRTVQKDFNRARYFDAQEAMAYGIVDRILPPPRTVAQELAQAQADAAAGKGRAVAGGPVKPQGY
jgi:ATP-dependent Clp protease, protease subunit